MKCVIFLALTLVAFSNASLWGSGTQREIRVDGDRRIFLRGSRKMVAISVPRDDPRCIEIVVKAQDGMLKVIKLNDDQQIIRQVSLVVPRNGREGMIFENRDTETRDNDRQRFTETELRNNHQMTILLSIFRKYEGIADEAKFYQLLKEIRQYVDRKELHPVIYDTIKELEVSPTNRSYMDESYGITETGDRRENYVNGENAKPRDFRDLTSEKHDMEPQTHDSLDQRIKLTQALQAARQIQWIQGLLENRRDQQLRDNHIHLRHEGDISRDTDAFLRLDGNRRDDDLRQMVLQTNIQELQREILQEQLKAQQLQIQEQFLNGQKQQLRLHRRVAQRQGLQAIQLQELRETYDQVQKQEEKLIEEQLEIQKIVTKLQDRLIRLHEELKDDLRKENNREERY